MDSRNKDRASAVIIKGNSILLIHRINDGREYYILPGGGVEDGESIMEALSREIKEETGLNIEIDKKICEYNNNERNRIEHVFMINKFKGYLNLGGPEIERSSDDNIYNLEWHNIGNLKKINFFPDQIINKIEEACRC